jgi:hypothetical protein
MDMRKQEGKKNKTTTITITHTYWLGGFFKIGMLGKLRVLLSFFHGSKLRFASSTLERKARHRSLSLSRRCSSPLTDLNHNKATSRECRKAWKNPSRLSSMTRGWKIMDD